MRPGSLLAAAALAAISCNTTPAAAPGTAGRLVSRPGDSPPAAACEAGLRRLGLDAERDAYLFVPRSAGEAPAPLLVLLHGAGGAGKGMAEWMHGVAEANGVLLVAPSSGDFTWDAIVGTLGADVRRVDRALASVFERCAVDRSRIAIGGFSDGASYALALGLANGDLFARVVAFSPGFIPGSPEVVGKPAVFLSHGRADEILPIQRSGRPIAALLRKAGYEVVYEEFLGAHEVPKEVAKKAFQWVSARPSL